MEASWIIAGCKDAIHIMRIGTDAVGICAHVWQCNALAQPKFPAFAETYGNADGIFIVVSADETWGSFAIVLTCQAWSLTGIDFLE